MILVGQYDSPYVRRVAVSLHALGISFERRTLSVFADAEAMRRINPLGRIPSLILDDGEVLVDSNAILDHLDEVAGGERALVARTGPARRRELQLVAVATGAIDKAAAIAYERLLRPAEKQHAPWLERCSVQLQSALVALEAYAGGGRLSLEPLRQPAITTACLIGYLRHRLADQFPARACPALEAQAEQAEQMACFQQAPIPFDGAYLPQSTEPSR